jgi:hypothetical protein
MDSISLWHLRLRRAESIQAMVSVIGSLCIDMCLRQTHINFCIDVLTTEVDMPERKRLCYKEVSVTDFHGTNSRCKKTTQEGFRKPSEPTHPQQISTSTFYIVGEVGTKRKAQLQYTQRFQDISAICLSLYILDIMIYRCVAYKCFLRLYLCTIYNSMIVWVRQMRLDVDI